MLCSMVSDGGGEHGSVTSIESSNESGQKRIVVLRIPPGTPPVANADRARHRAWSLVMDSGVELPESALGEIIIAAQRVLLLGVLAGIIAESDLPGRLKELAKVATGEDASQATKVRDILKLVGKVLTGMDNVKNPVEVVNILIAVLEAIKPALADGKIDISELPNIVAAGVKEIMDGDTPA